MPKEQTFNELKIKIDKVREVIGGKGNYAHKDKMYLIDIKRFGGGIAFSVKATGHCGRDLRKVFRRIQEELHLK